MVVVPLLVPHVLAQAGWPGNLVLALSLLVSVLWSGSCGMKIHRLMAERANYQLGFEGERFVSEELSGLAAAGFQIYHDVPFDGYNLDHVLVGRQGVFLVETKTRRKPVNEAGGINYHVEYDGECLRWPMGRDVLDLAQASDNARTLSQWLTSAVGERVWVVPILTLPGWMVDRTTNKARVQVLNPKEIAKYCAAGAAQLDEKLIDRICHQLNQKCKLKVGEDRGEGGIKHRPA